jgi:hypothetical protein
MLSSGRLVESKLHRIDLTTYFLFSSKFRLYGPMLAVWLSVFGHGLARADGTGQSISGQSIAFDIPAQPLVQALDVYGRVTGMAALVDQALISGRHSAVVKGILTPDEALRILVAGNGLSVQYTGGKAFTLKPADDEASNVSHAFREQQGGGPDDDAYLSDLQENLARVLCRRPETRPGSYRLGLQLWISSEGHVSASHLLDSSGDANRDRAISDSLLTLPVISPPRSLPQPITIVLLPQSGNLVSECHRSGEGAR